MSFLYRVAGLTLRYRVRSSERLRVEPLLLHVKRSQLMWFVHLVRMPPGRLQQTHTYGQMDRSCNRKSKKMIVLMEYTIHAYCLRKLQIK